MREIFIVEKQNNKIVKETRLSGETLSDIYYSVKVAEINRQKNFPKGGCSECLPETLELLNSLNLEEIMPDEY